MFRNLMLSAAAAATMFAASTNAEAGDRFSLGVNLGGGYPVYSPAPVVVQPYPTVYAPSYGYGYGGYGYAQPGVSFGYNNYGRSYRPYSGHHHHGGHGHYGHGGHGHFHGGHGHRR